MCLSSRREQAFVLQFANVPGFEIEKYTRNDMKKYVRETLDVNIPGYTWMSSNGQPLILDDIVSSIVDYAKGVFLWTKLVSLELLDGASHFDTPEQLWKILESIPTEITDLYRRILYKIPERYAYQTYVMLETVRCAYRPLEWGRFGFVVETEVPGTLSCRSKSDGEIPDYYYTWLTDALSEAPQSWHAQISAHCRGLLEIDSSYGVFSHAKFLHRTLKDFVDNGEHKILLQKKIRSIMDGHLYHCRAMLRFWKFVVHW